MSSTRMRSETAIETPRARRVDMKLEVVVIPVSDVDRAQRFYSNLGWRLDADFGRGDAFRAVQFTPPGSSCSIHFGTGITSAVPGSAQGLFLVVSDIEAARAEARRSRCRRRRSVPPWRRGRPPQRPRSGAAQLPLVRHVQRSGRQRMAVAGSHRAIARTGGRGPHDIHLVD
jgi:catechol 2,3-dioxygenase-like lactoylglutathione lyase family enzyme